MTYPERQRQRQEQSREHSLDRRCISRTSQQELATAIDDISDTETQQTLSIMFEIITGQTVTDVLESGEN